MQTIAACIKRTNNKESRLEENIIQGREENSPCFPL
jgi:hypothetical protein